MHAQLNQGGTDFFPPLLVFSPTTRVLAGLGSWLLLFSMYTMANGLHLVGENLPAGRQAPTRVVDRESCTFIMEDNFIVRKASKFFHGV